MQNINDIPIKSECSKEKSYLFYNVAKRCFDLICSLIALILFSPIFLILYIWVKVDSKGPAFFGHKRIGKDRKYIDVYKFRSMVSNAKACLHIQHTFQLIYLLLVLIQE